MATERIELIDPLLPDPEAVMADVRTVFENKWFSNYGPFVRRLEKEVAEAEEASHAVAVASGTIGLVVALRALERKGEVIIPAFTFPATAHAVVSAGLEPVIADVTADTFTLDPASVARLVGPQTAAVMPVTCFGVPADLDAIAGAAPGVPIVVDDAQGWGSRRPAATTPAATVLSLHATKTVMAGEGGMVLTHDAALAHQMRRMVNFGFVPGGDCDVIGLNAKMPELSAVLGCHSIPLGERTMAARTAWADRYREAFADTRGMSFQTIPEDVRWNGQAFSILVDPEAFGRTRDDIRLALEAQNIVTRRYFHPAVHQLECYAGKLRADDLPVTERLSAQVLCLPSRAASPVEQAGEIAALVNAAAEAPAST